MDTREELRELKAMKAYLKTQRDPYDSGVYADISDFLNISGDDIQGNLDKGRRRGTKIFNSEPTLALQTWTDGMFSQIFNPATIWLRPTLPMSFKFLETESSVRKYLQDKQEVMMYALQRSNFYSMKRQFLKTGGSFGTVVENIDEDKSTGKICFTSLHVRESYIAENQYGKVDTVIRAFKMTARQMKQKFGEEVLSEAVRTCLRENGNRYKEFDIVHAVYPNDEFDSKKIGNKFKKFASKWFEASIEDKFLRESGYDLFPFPTWRCYKGDNSAYGDSPATFALPEIIGSQAINKDLYRISNIAAFPAFNVPTYMKGKFDNGPNGFNYFKHAEEKATPMTSGINYPIPFEFNEKIISIIERHYHVDFFLAMMRSDKPMTAREVMARQAETAALISASTGDLMIVADEELDIVDEIETRAGRMPQIPDIMLEFIGDDVKLNYEYLGPLPQAQKLLFETRSIENVFAPDSPAAFLMQLWPEVQDVVKKDGTFRRILNAYGYPQSELEDNEVIEQIREGRAVQQAEALKKVDMDKMADILKKLGMAGKQSQGKMDSIIYGLLQGGATPPPEIAA